MLVPLFCGCSTTNSYPVDLIISDIRLYSEPGVPPLNGVSIAINDGKIVEVGLSIAAESAVVLDGGSRVATAGLWNSHVHFMDPALETDAAGEVRDMLLQYGFTSVLDTGSDLAATIELSKSIERGEIAGPRIFMANGSFVYIDATPVYLPGIQLPEIEDPNQAEAMVATVMDSGAQGIKIFAGSFMSRTDTIHLPPEIIRAVANATHKRGGFLVSHPNDRIGLVNSVENGVDVLAHTAPGPEPLGDELIAIMKNNNVALIPTLKLWSYELRRGGTPEKVVQFVQGSAIAQLSDYYVAGGEVLFGTDTGYMRDFNTKDEFMHMRKAGMDFDGILASMTTNPASRFASESGLLEVGATADVVVYAGDPSKDVAEFSQVQYTIRAGKLVFCADESQSESPCH
ncbi:MAG: amidohydrolase family protein [Gammaproteobacteria bacterium]|nr:amidohydrolase family protein [Gammaproteobacteria bacterium]